MNYQNDNTVFVKKEKAISKPVEQKPQVTKRAEKLAWIPMSFDNGIPPYSSTESMSG